MSLVGNKNIIDKNKSFYSRLRAQKYSQKQLLQRRFRFVRKIDTVHVFAIFKLGFKNPFVRQPDQNTRNSWNKLHTGTVSAVFHSVSNITASTSQNRQFAYHLLRTSGKSAPGCTQCWNNSSVRNQRRERENLQVGWSPSQEKLFPLLQICFSPDNLSIAMEYFIFQPHRRGASDDGGAKEAHGYRVSTTIPRLHAILESQFHKQVLRSDPGARNQRLPAETLGLIRNLLRADESVWDQPQPWTWWLTSHRHPRLGVFPWQPRSGSVHF